MRGRENGFDIELARWAAKKPRCSTACSFTRCPLQTRADTGAREPTVNGNSNRSRCSALCRNCEGCAEFSGWSFSIHVYNRSHSQAELRDIEYLDRLSLADAPLGCGLYITR